MGEEAPPCTRTMLATHTHTHTHMHMSARTHTQHNPIYTEGTVPPPHRNITVSLSLPRTPTQGVMHHVLARARDAPLGNVNHSHPVLQLNMRTQRCIKHFAGRSVAKHGTIIINTPLGASILVFNRKGHNYNQAADPVPGTKHCATHILVCRPVARPACSVTILQHPVHEQNPVPRGTIPTVPSVLRRSGTIPFREEPCH